MKLSDYVQYTAGLEIEELKRELKELEKKMEFVKSVLAMKTADETEASTITGEDSTSRAVITHNDIKYGILRFPASSPIAQALQKDSRVTIEYKGVSFECSVPKLENYPTQKGRINGLKKVYDRFEEFAENRTVIAKLHGSNARIKIVEVL